MDEKIRGFYTKMIHDLNLPDKIDREMQEEISAILKEEKMRMDEKEYEGIQDKAFLIASAAEENGFVKGFRYASRLFAECISED